MKITADLSDVSVELGNKGITLRIADPQGNHVGDLRLGRSAGEWMRGKTHEGNGISFPITKLIELLNGIEGPA